MAAIVRVRALGLKAATLVPQRGFASALEDKEIKKSVFISQSYDIFTNLALEDWIYRNFDFKNHHVLMLWSNNPCVVIGRHQNPWVEANISALERNGVALARRNSGGGTVYHDRGNLNCTFFTPRDRYNRKYNLSLITRALFREWSIKADISERDDILFRGKKISGTAAKLGQPNAYHHCTLLVNSNKDQLTQALTMEKNDIQSRATKSVPAQVKNLTDANKQVNVPQLLSAIGYEFLRTNPTELVDGGRELVMKQRGFQLINPTEKWFPGITTLRDNFEAWDWRFGRTPKFSVEKSIELKSEEKIHNVKLHVDVEGGIMTEITLMLSQGGDALPVVSSLKGREYSEENMSGIIAALKGVSAENVKLAMNNL
ncbi:lipoyltransferase 1, mitochondrial isoform X2 [Phlebotomus argentipes]|uniref:lipoyltransferase 1, mitochondrial isoform X2 n=1 Tax=Phlebotomus argentipes TaxID=94469 RepID=UPI002892A15C|nr:lipoyltransferase 1, mitochondrial isoform X2 [Phlebotomus argentipes]